MRTIDDYFGSTDPRQMPEYLFYGAVRLDYSSVIRANIEKQNYSTCPRHWYIDATIVCQDCKLEFTWSAAEQRTWFEEYGFYVDSLATRCPQCRHNRRHLKALKQEYDRTVSRARSGGTLEDKKRVLSLIDQIEEISKYVPKDHLKDIDDLFNSRPTGMEKTKALLLAQIRKAERRAEGDNTGAGQSPNAHE